MRDLKEYKEEIFRRGEDKIQARKKRTSRFLACGATFGLCLILCGIFLIPRNAETALGEQNDASQQTPSVSVVFFDPQGSSQEVGRGNAAQIYYSIQSAFLENEENVKNDDVISETVPNQGVSDSVVFPPRDDGDQSLDHDGNVSDKYNGNGGHGNGLVYDSVPSGGSDGNGGHGNEFVNGSVSEYRITLTDEQGVETMYLLCGNTLTEESSGKKVLLSKAQLEELLALFDEK